MTESASAVFRVVDDAGEYLWLREVEGPGKGLQVAIPVRHEEYTGELRERIAALEPEEVTEATLRSTNERNTAWRFEQLPPVDADTSDHPDGRGTAAEAPADD